METNPEEVIRKLNKLRTRILSNIQVNENKVYNLEKAANTMLPRLRRILKKEIKVVRKSIKTQEKYIKFIDKTIKNVSKK